MKNFSEKHIFFCRDMDTFINLFVDSLICKLNLNKDDLLIIVIPTKDRYPFNKALDVKYIDYKYECHADYAKAKSLSFISLNNTNSTVINEIIQTSDDVIKKLFILITDDEVDRWNKNFNENFSLDEDFNQNISKEVIKSLSYNLNFIMPQEYFYPILSKIINLEKKILSTLQSYLIFYLRMNPKNSIIKLRLHLKEKKRFCLVLNQVVLVLEHPLKF